MHHFLLLRGIMVGFLLCASVPFGPVALTCIRRTLASGWREGFLAVTGAAVADGIFGAILAFGFGAVPGFFAGHEMLVRAVGGVLLVLMGIHLIRLHQDQAIGETRQDMTVWQSSAAIFMTAVANPLALGAMAVLFGAFGLAGHQTTVLRAVTVAFGVAIGSLLWWAVLSGFLDALRDKFNPAVVNAINRTIGLILVVCGVAVLVWM